MKRTGDIRNFLEAVEASARMGSQYIWKVSIELPDREGEGYVMGGKLIYLKIGDLKGNEALKALRKYDRFAYSIEIFNGYVPEIHDIDILELYHEELSPMFSRLPITTVKGNFVDILMELEERGFNGIISFSDREGRGYIGTVCGGRLCGIRYLGVLGSTSTILQNIRELSTDFYLLEFKYLDKISGFIYGLKDIVDSPAGQWNAQKLKRINGTVEVTRGTNRILVISDGSNVITIFGLSIPPSFGEDIIPLIFQRGNLINTYPATEPKPIFEYTFKEARTITNIFSSLVSESRKIVGEIVFKRAADKVLNYYLPPKPYPDDIVNTLKSIFSIYEKEISAFTGKKWKEKKASILSEYPERLVKLFG
ncbi:MAG: hypothetical protein ABIL16_06695 [candidate division WOR-3 bacterium]